MRITFVGVGEAFDPDLPNCSVLVETKTGGAHRAILLDCGFTAPFALFRALAGDAGARKALNLDMVWISHFHGDHFLGLPALLLRFYEEERVKPLTIVGQAGVEDVISLAMDLAYPGLRERFPYPIVWHEATPNVSLSLLDLRLDCAYSEHPQPNLSLRLDDGERGIFYSGDGRPTGETLALAAGVDLVIHESFSMEQDTPGHGTVPGSIDFARQAGAKALALVHLRRDVRREKIEQVRSAMNRAHLPVFLPEPGETMTL